MTDSYGYNYVSFIHEDPEYYLVSSVFIAPSINRAVTDSAIKSFHIIQKKRDVALNLSLKPSDYLLGQENCFRFNKEKNNLSPLDSDQKVFIELKCV